jgi:hypothetical protein
MQRKELAFEGRNRHLLPTSRSPELLRPVRKQGILSGQFGDGSGKKFQ